MTQPMMTQPNKDLVLRLAAEVASLRLAVKALQDKVFQHSYCSVCKNADFRRSQGPVGKK